MEISQFYIAGINYKKTDAAVRGQFAINNDQYIALTQKAAHYGITEFFVLSTCNRTEIYGRASHVADLVNLLCSETAGTTNTFNQLAYIKNGHAAVEHLFSVAAGLDSQILGDYEIVGQLKLASRIAKEQGYIGTFLDRLLNCVLQSSKAIKTQTQLSGGTVSVSFAAIQFLKEQCTNIQQKKILLLGTGKIGRNTCKNLVDYLETRNITLLNRTDAKAAELASELGLRTAPFEALKQEVMDADIIIVATNSAEPVITKADLQHSTKKILIDLSIPNNIEPACAQLAHITLVNVDGLSAINDITLQKRVAEVPKAKAIINEHIVEFTAWHGMRRNVPVLKAAKEKLHNMHNCALFQAAYANTTMPAYVPQDNIQKIITNMAVKMQQQRQPGCNYIEAINDYISGCLN